MATNSLPQPAELAEAVEAFFDTLPEKRRRKRTRAEINADYDVTPERENYDTEPESTITIELNDTALTRLPVLLRQLGQARSNVVAEVVTMKILALLGLELEDK